MEIYFHCYSTLNWLFQDIESFYCTYLSNCAGFASGNTCQSLLGVIITSVAGVTLIVNIVAWTLTIMNLRIIPGQKNVKKRRENARNKWKVAAKKLKGSKSNKVLDAGLFISVYLSSLPVAHMSDDLRRRLAVTGDSARIQDETTESSTWFFKVLGV